jgi:hypothetical protein
VADYSAKIKLIVEGQQQIKTLQQQVSSLQKQIKELARLDIGGVFEAEPLRSAVAGLRQEKEKLSKSTKSNISLQQQSNKNIERQLLNQIKLNAAVDLYDRRLKQVERSNAATQQQFSGRIEEIGKAFKFFKDKGSVSGVRAVATELGRIVEYENEILLTERKREANAAKSRRYAKELNLLELQGLNTQKAREKFQKFASVADTNKIKQAAIYQDALENQLRVLRAQVQENVRLARIAPSSPVRGGAAFPGSPEFLQAQRRNRTERISNVALGAGFPLLFGGGPGAVLGGAAGGLVGGPAAFAAQIGLSALGQQLDLLVAATAKASTAFTSTSAAFAMMEEKALFSNEATRELAIQLEEQGKVSELSALLTKELTDTLGNEGVKAMQELGQTTDKTTKLWNQLTLQLQALIAGPLNGFLTWVNTALSSISTSLRFNALQRELDNNAEFRAEVQRRRAARGRGARLGSLSAADQAELIKQFGGLIAPKTQIPVTAEDLRTITAPRGAKGPKPPADQTAQLAADLKAMQLMSVTQDGIRDALFEGNRQLAIRLEYDQKVYDINRDTEKALLRANYESEKTLIRAQEVVRLKDAELEKADKLRELERDITEEYYNRAGLSTRNLTQRAGAGAFDINLDLDPNNKVTQKYDEMKQRLEELSDPINAAAQGAAGIGNAFSTAFQGIITGTQSTQEALSNFFKGVGDAFVSMATEIIAQMVVMFAFKQLLGLFGGSGGSLFSGAGPVSGASVFGAGQASFNPAAFAPGVAFAEGGFVTNPTRALIGEGGEPEYVIPQSKMTAAMSRYSRGARGESVIPGNGTSTEGGGTATATMEPIDVRYSVERINNVDYVTADQFQRGMAQAARQGAIQGERSAMRTLGSSPAARRRLGI